MRTIPAPQIAYTPVGDDVMASVKNSKHTLLWERSTGAVYRDSDRRPLYYHLTEQVFHVQAESLFGGNYLSARHASTARECGRRRVVRSSCDIDGAGWEAMCNCGHWRTGWKPSWWQARRALTAHLKTSRGATQSGRLDLDAVKRAGVRIPKQRSNA